VTHEDGGHGHSPHFAAGGGGGGTASGFGYGGYARSLKVDQSANQIQ